MLNLATLLEESARTVPTRTAVIFSDVKLTYAAVTAAANQVANGLAARGIGPGDKVALTCPNLPVFPIAYYGILKTGAPAVPLNVLLRGREIAYHLQDSDAKAISASRAPWTYPWASTATKASARSTRVGTSS